MKIWWKVFHSRNSMYTLMDAVSYLRWQIEQEEKRMKEAVSPAKRKWLEGNIEWMFERALGLIALAKPGEIQQEALDFFLGRVKERPDFTRLKKALEKKDSGSWLQRILNRIREL